MRATEYLNKLKLDFQANEWALQLIPAAGGGADVSELPTWLREQLITVGLGNHSPEKAVRAAVEQIDWAHDTYSRLVEDLPPRYRARLAISDDLAVGCISDAEFNGFVGATPNGKGSVVVVPTGALMLIGFAANLYSFRTSPILQKILVEAGLALFHYQTGSVERGLRWLRRRWQERQFKALDAARIATELQILLNRYADLGVADPPDLIREIQFGWGGLPLLGQTRRIAHPLEPGTYLVEFACRFLLLHECGHLLLDHESQTNLEQSRKQEFEADRCAMELALASSKTDQTAVGSLLGAWLLLTILNRLEDGEPWYGRESTHPPAGERLQRLVDFVSNADQLSIPARKLALGFMKELAAIEEDLSLRAKWLRSEEVRTMNTLELFLEMCIREGRQNAFKDQVPRWILFGAPRRLCFAIADARVSCEQEVQERRDDKRANSKLQLLMWIFDAAAAQPRSSVNRRLRDAYWQARSNRQSASMRSKNKQ